MYPFVDISIKNAIANKFFTFFLSPRDICHQLSFSDTPNKGNIESSGNSSRT